MGPKRRPSRRDCALAQAALEIMEASEASAVAAPRAILPRQAESGARPGETAVRNSALIVKGRDLFAPALAARAIRLIDLERRARFVRVAS